jgi:hypothetical protein
MKDFSFQGKIYLGENLGAGKPGRLVWVGDQSSCQLQLSSDSEDRTETYSGKRLQSARLTTGITATLNLTLRYFTPENVKLGLYAQASNVAASAIPGEELPDDLVAGDKVVLDRTVGVTGLTIEDAAGAAVVLGTNYTFDPDAGLITIVDPGALQQPFVAEYSHAAFTSMPLFTADPPERYLFLDGVNTLDGSRIRMHLYRVRFDPASELDLINDSFGELALVGAVLYDGDAAADATLGGFGRFEVPTEA